MTPTEKFTSQMVATELQHAVAGGRQQLARYRHHDPKHMNKLNIDLEHILG